MCIGLRTFIIRFLVIQLVRKKLRLKLGQHFQFEGQKHTGFYYFTPTTLIAKKSDGYQHPSSVSMNWLLNKNCKIIKM